MGYLQWIRAIRPESTRSLSLVGLDHTELALRQTHTVLIGPGAVSMPTHGKTTFQAPRPPALVPEQPEHQRHRPHCHAQTAALAQRHAISQSCRRAISACWGPFGPTDDALTAPSGDTGRQRGPCALEDVWNAPTSASPGRVHASAKQAHLARSSGKAGGAGPPELGPPRGPFCFWKEGCRRRGPGPARRARVCHFRATGRTGEGEAA